jgi:hypothetical protein
VLARVKGEHTFISKLQFSPNTKHLLVTFIRKGRWIGRRRKEVGSKWGCARCGRPCVNALAFTWVATGPSTRCSNTLHVSFDRSPTEYTVSARYYTATSLRSAAGDYFDDHIRLSQIQPSVEHESLLNFGSKGALDLELRSHYGNWWWRLCIDSEMSTRSSDEPFLLTATLISQLCHDHLVSGTPAGRPFQQWFETLHDRLMQASVRGMVTAFSNIL